MTIASFAPANGVFLSVGAVSSNATIPSGGTIAVVTNIGKATVFLAIGTSSTLAATNAGLPVLPGGQTALTIGSATTIAAVALAGATGLSVVAGN